MKIEASDVNYPIYKCLFSCPAKDYIYFIKEGDQKYECLKSCPQGNKFIIETIENNYEYLSGCPYDYPYYLNNPDGHIKCTNVFPCNDVKYINNDICVESCSSKIERKICVK